MHFLNCMVFILKLKVSFFVYLGDVNLYQKTDVTSKFRSGILAKTCRYSFYDGQSHIRFDFIYRSHKYLEVSKYLIGHLEFYVGMKKVIIVSKISKLDNMKINRILNWLSLKWFVFPKWIGKNTLHVSDILV